MAVLATGMLKNGSHGLKRGEAFLPRDPGNSSGGRGDERRAGRKKEDRGGSGKRSTPGNRSENLLHPELLRRA
jgi:hypothetical protein